MGIWGLVMLRRSSVVPVPSGWRLGRSNVASPVAGSRIELWAWCRGPSVGLWHNGVRGRRNRISWLWNMVPCNKDQRERSFTRDPSDPNSGNCHCAFKQSRWPFPTYKQRQFPKSTNAEWEM